ncbi:MAG TPA: CoA transferase [Candidatus Binataceae bacterium]|nr:CoA transferase [Candidatus Binataceae bacterium]
MLSPYKVLDLSDERGQLCGQILGDLGADVVLVEPPEGSRSRHTGPFYRDQPHRDRSLGFWAFNRNKRSITLDLDREADRDKLRKLAAGADFLIESVTPGDLAKRGLGYADLSALNPRLIYVSISAFGQDGPKADFAATDLTLVAAGGTLLLQGDADRSPLRITVPQAFLHASADGAASALIAHHERLRSGLGQHIDVSAQESISVAAFSQPLVPSLGTVGVKRESGGVRAGKFIARQVWPARDGHVVAVLWFGPAIGPATSRLMQCAYEHGFCDEATRDTDWMTLDAKLSSGEVPMEEFERLKGIVERFTRSLTKAELMKLALEKSLLMAPVATIDEVVDSPHFNARGYWTPIAHPELEAEVRYAGAFAKFSESPIAYRRRPPSLGEHNDDVMREWLPRTEETRPARSTSGRTSVDGAMPLAGLKVVDLFWAMAGPATTRVLSDYGATVVKVESSRRPDTCRTIGPYVQGQFGIETSGLFMNLNAGKLGVTLDLSDERGRQIFRDLVRWADVVTESFSPKAMRAWGLDYPALKQIKPDIIMVSSCLMGQTGPFSKFAGYGNLAAAISGFGNLCGWPDRAPAGPYGSYTDCVAPRFTISSILAALEYRRRTGRGQYIDISQAEASMTFLAPAILEYTANGRVQRPSADRDRLMAPHGAYPCAGEDSWIAIACGGDADWSALCALMKREDLARDARFATVDARLVNQDDLDAILSAWTRNRDGVELELQLQARKIPAAKVASSTDMLTDPQLVHRGHIVELEHSKFGKVPIERWPFKLSRTPGGPTRVSPTLGRDNAYVLENFLGYDKDRVRELLDNGIMR